MQGTDSEYKEAKEKFQNELEQFRYFWSKFDDLETKKHLENLAKIWKDLQQAMDALRKDQNNPDLISAVNKLTADMEDEINRFQTKKQREEEERLKKKLEEERRLKELEDEERRKQKSFVKIQYLHPDVSAQIHHTAEKLGENAIGKLERYKQVKDDAIIKTISEASKMIADLLHRLANASTVEEMIELALKISELCKNIKKFALEAAENCRDPVLAQNLVGSATAVGNMATQLKIICAVKMHQTQAPLAAQLQLVRCAQNLCGFVETTLANAEVTHLAPKKKK